MLLATTVSGGLMMLVHNSAGRIGADQYGLFTTMLDTLLLLGIPAGGVQGVFAQMTAFAVTEAGQRHLRATVRGVLRAGLWLGVLLAVALLFTQGMLARFWKTEGVAVLWVTLLTAWVTMGYPVFSGVLQGRQEFLWLGNSSMASGLGRLVAVTALVLGFGALATGAMVGVLLGAVIATAVAWWAARDILRGPDDGDFRLSRWLGRLLPVTLGLAAGSVMLSFDTPFVRGTLTEANLGSMEDYAAAGRVGRGLVMFTMPMAMVLFPRAARSAATGEASNALRLALGATLGTGLAAALACTLLPELPIRVLFAGQPKYLNAAALVPWFAWAMLPLTAAYTLVNNLIAQARFAAVPWLVAVAAAYVGSLSLLRHRLALMPPFEAFRVVLGVLGVFSVLLLLVAVFFTRSRRRGEAPSERAN